MFFSFLFLSIRGLNVTSVFKYRSSNILTLQGSVVFELIKLVSPHPCVDLFKYLRWSKLITVHAISASAKSPTGHRLGFKWPIGLQPH